MALAVSIASFGVSFFGYRLSRRNANLTEPYIVSQIAVDEVGLQIRFRLDGPNADHWEVSQIRVPGASRNRLCLPIIGDDGYTSGAIIGRHGLVHTSLDRPPSPLYFQLLEPLPATVEFVAISRSNSALRFIRKVRYTKID